MGDFIEIINYTIHGDFYKNYKLHNTWVDFIEIINYTIHGGFYRNYKQYNICIL